MNFIDIGVLILISFLLGAGIVLLTGIVNKTEDKFKTLENSIKKLEEAQAKRLPHSSAAAIEDGISTLINAKRMQDELKTEIEALGFWIDKGTEFFQGARGGAYYDHNIPSENRVKRK